MTSRLGAPRYAGDDVGYTGAHFRARDALAGLPCSMADETCKGPIDAAMGHDTPDENRRTGSNGLEFSIRVEDYRPLCRPHHMRYDGHRRLDRCHAGHPFDEANTRVYVRADRVERVCRACKNEKERAARRRRV